MSGTPPTFPSPPAVLPYGEATPVPVAWGSPYGGPPGFMAPPPPPGEFTRRAILGVRDALGYYWATLILSVISGVAASVALGVGFGGGLGLLASSEASSYSVAALSGPGATAIADLGSVIGLVVLLLTLYAWYKWREASDDLERRSREFGPGPANAAHRARQDITWSTYVFIVNLVVVLGVAIAITLIVIATTIGPLLNNTTTVHPPVALSGAAIAQLRGMAIGIVVIETIGPYAPPSVLAGARVGRKYALVGAALSALGIVSFFVPYTAILAVIPTILLVYGYYEIRRAFDAVLSAPIAVVAEPPPIGLFEI